jgi:hypothetical protein
MPLSCPRCGTAVPSEAMYCPYCSLPKPKRGFAAAEEKPREATPPEPPKPSVTHGRSKKDVSAQNEERPAGRSIARPRKPALKARISVLGVAALVALVSAGIYIFVVPMVYSEDAEPKTVLAALDKLRKTPSNEPALTIDARLSRELETARRVGNLVAYQGWTVRPIKGNKSKVVLAFSYVEVGDVRQSAEWIADLTNGTFTPQSELATTVHGKQ